MTNIGRVSVRLGSRLGNGIPATSLEPLPLPLPENRELFLSLREKENAALRDSIVTGRTSPKDLVEFDKDVSPLFAFS
jgi:hypothetical protein